MATSLVWAMVARWALLACGLADIGGEADRAVNWVIDGVWCIFAGWRGLTVHHAIFREVARCTFHLVGPGAVRASHTFRALSAGCSMLVWNLIICAVYIAVSAAYLAERGSCFSLLSCRALLWLVICLRAR
jgi:hypothetical protein